MSAYFYGLLLASVCSAEPSSLIPTAKAETSTESTPSVVAPIVEQSPVLVDTAPDSACCESALTCAGEQEGYLDNISLLLALDGSKQPQDLGVNAQFGGRGAVNMGVPLVRDWGLGLDQVRLSTADRHDRHFAILALTYVLLCAFGAAAETFDIARQLKANTRHDRVMSLARIGNYFVQLYRCPLKQAFAALQALPT